MVCAGRNLPNPFNSQTKIAFSLPAKAKVKLSLWDVNGRWMRDLAVGEYSSGQHQILFDAGDIPAGIFIVELESRGKTLPRKALLIK
ncbi:MAG: T9SS type A sorting domain-containing protein [Calditrichota bacterium]